MNLKSKLSETRVLWLSFAATLLITIAFPVVVSTWGLTLLDAISNPDAARTAIAAMSEPQRHVHAWMTATLDVAYPFAYASLFFGSAHKFFPKIGWLLSIPAVLLLPIDLVEGVIQIMALTDVADALSLKAVLTTSKQVLFLTGIVFTIAGWIKWVIVRFTLNQNSRGH